MASENLKQTKINLAEGLVRPPFDPYSSRFQSELAHLMRTPGASTNKPETMLILPRRAGKTSAYEALGEKSPGGKKTHEPVYISTPKGDSDSLFEKFVSSAGAAQAASRMAKSAADIASLMSETYTTTWTTGPPTPALTVAGIAKMKAEIDSFKRTDRISEMASDIKKAELESMMATRKSAAEVAAITEAMGELVAKVNTWIEETKSNSEDMDSLVGGNIQTVVSLKGPGSLTIKKDGQYSKAPHIGGEEFTLAGVYLGKRGTIIGQFEPATKGAYDYLEMTVGEAADLLNGFGEIAVECVEDGLFVSINKIQQAATAAHEIEANKSKFNEYATFGSW